MYWLDNNTGIATPPSTPAVVSSSKRYFTNGGAGVQPSTPGDFWFHMVQEELLGILTLAGITPDKADLNQVAKAIQSIAFSAYPVGAPIPWPTAVPPSGFLAMIGQSFSATTYPMLAQAYPSLTLPDMRAEFIRGWDGGRGVDSGRAIRSSQSDAMRNLTGSITSDAIKDGTTQSSGLLGSGVFSGAGSSVAGVAVQGINYAPGNNFRTLNFDASSVVPTSTENRPRNIAYNYIVRAA